VFIDFCFNSHLFYVPSVGKFVSCFFVTIQAGNVKKQLPVCEIYFHSSNFMDIVPDVK